MTTPVETKGERFLSYSAVLAENCHPHTSLLVNLNSPKVLSVLNNGFSNGCGYSARTGGQTREQGISKAGNRPVRGMAIEIAWGWLRHQPQSELTLWYEERFGHGSKRLRKIGIVALARKLLIALWHYLETGEIPAGAQLKAYESLSVPLGGEEWNQWRDKMKRNQLIVFFVLLVIYAICAFLTYALFTDQLATVTGVPMPDMGVSNAVMGLANAGIILVLYGILGLAGYWFSNRLGLPGIYRKDGNWRLWLLTPFVLGTLCGLALVIGDLVFAPINGLGHFPHPPFPLSILASISAGIGEEILYRSFVFGVWALLLNWVLYRFNGGTVAFWIANIIAALAFGAGHLGSVMVLTSITTLADLNPVLLVEIFLLNGIVGLVAGNQYVKTGLIAAIGVHFWADVFWHVLWGLFS